MCRRRCEEVYEPILDRWGRVEGVCVCVFVCRGVGCVGGRGRYDTRKHARHAPAPHPRPRRIAPPPARSLHYIKLTDTTTGVGHIDLNRISGYIPGKMVVLLMNVRGARGRGVMGGSLRAGSQAARRLA